MLGSLFPTSKRLVWPEILRGMCYNHWICVVIWVTSFVCKTDEGSYFPVLYCSGYSIMTVATTSIDMGHTFQPVSMVVALPCKNLWWDQLQLGNVLMLRRCTSTKTNCSKHKVVYERKLEITYDIKSRWKSVNFKTMSWNK